MKPLPPTPALNDLFRLLPDRVAAVLERSAGLDDSAYLHWESLRHRKPPGGLSDREWWFALKWRRSSAAVRVPLLRATNDTPLTYTRHARVELGVSKMDRLLAGRQALPQAAANPATRDQYLASSLMEEAIHSSLFEGAVSTREAAKDMLRSRREPMNRDERMILNNFRAMERLREMAAAPLSLEGILELHRILTDGTLDDPGQAGRVQRPGEVRVDVIDHRVNRVVHTPPPAEQLPDRMAALVEFANAPDIENSQYLHPVIRSILLHFQLAYDHPFYDGNGRTARALFYWSMLHRGYWLAEFFSISRLLYRNRRPYELAYQQVESDAQDATYFLIQQLEVLDQAVAELFAYVERKGRAQLSLRRRLVDRGDLNHRQLALLDHALRRPEAEYTHDSHATSHRISGVTARTDLLGLVAKGWLRQVRVGRRVHYLPIDQLEARMQQPDP
ncbi:Fic family protein [Silanimonas sp.]|uniref:Fic family protein n=1 Tax=Silanimonas sp. TaxID=1929290 RepID=UPI001BC22DCC|nr:Fic family protein [Silanimonas sp.]MBS3896822.1 Fic family protein [Silanimonas sp.]MBS3924184.1 Fic family protein [Xanthomonadaceae bacterium]